MFTFLVRSLYMYIHILIPFFIAFPFPLSPLHLASSFLSKTYLRSIAYTILNTQYSTMHSVKHSEYRQSQKRCCCVSYSFLPSLRGQCWGWGLRHPQEADPLQGGVNDRKPPVARDPVLVPQRKMIIIGASGEIG